MGIEPASLINTKAKNNDHDPTNYVTSITVSMGIEPTAPHTDRPDYTHGGSQHRFFIDLGSIPTTIYTLSSRAPTHRYLHAFLYLFTHCTHRLRAAQIVLDIQQHRCGWQLAPNFGNNAPPYRHDHHNMQTLSAVSCQRSAVSCRSFCGRVDTF